MKLLMHIGTHKTGTTTFQKICIDQKNLLSSNGINFPSYKNWQQHSYAAWVAQRREVSELKVFLESIYRETLELNCEVTLVSGEDFENFLVDTHLAKEFTKIALEVGFKELEWVVVQRDPLDYLQSIYAEQSKHKSVLDYKIMGRLILDFGYVSVGSPNYNYHFVFEINKFAEIFKNNVSKNLTVVPFRKFVEDFAGMVILSEFLSDHSKEILLEHSLTIQNKNERMRPEMVEYLYVANFLGVNADQNFYESNKGLVDNLINRRLKRNAQLLDTIKQEFEKRHF